MDFMQMYVMVLECDGQNFHITCNVVMKRIDDLQDPVQKFCIILLISEKRAKIRRLVDQINHIT